MVSPWFTCAEQLPVKRN